MYTCREGEGERERERTRAGLIIAGKAARETSQQDCLQGALGQKVVLVVEGLGEQRLSEHSNCKFGTTVRRAT